ncbi:hypothetical protein D3C71_1873700 [compost metagenome]
MTDTELIKALGGPAKVAEMLGFDKGNGGVQRVQNWLVRGIPAQVKVDHPDIFMKARAATEGPAPVPIDAADKAQVEQGA